MAIPATCRTCQFYDLDKVRDKAGRVRSDRVAECLWPKPALPYAYRAVLGDMLRARFVAPCDGIGCLTYQSRTDSGEIIGNPREIPIA